MAVTTPSVAPFIPVDLAMPISVTKPGPRTARSIRRSIVVYGVIFVVGLLPLISGASATWQAAGLGLWLPGGGFVAVGGWAVLLLPVTLLLFALAVFFWFGAGMIVAPPLVWLAAASAAGAMAGSEIAWPAPIVDAVLVIAFAGWMIRRSRRIAAAGSKSFAQRIAYLPAAISAAKMEATPAPPVDERELNPEQIASLRYAIDRALQPADEWNGFDKLDEFQTGARRYQINMLGYALGTAQTHYTPSFHGYLSEAQRRLIERYLRPEVWRYWVYETSWGQFNFRDWDPAKKDNIMLTGFFGQQVGLYMSATGDRRYAEPGSLPFRLNAKTVYSHSAATIAESLIQNFRRSPYGLYPCEPNWIYAVCNHLGMTSLVVLDRVLGTQYVPEILDDWLHSLDTEFTNAAGSIVPLRSELTGFEFKMAAGEAGFAPQTNTFAPARAWRQWGIARTELRHVVKPGTDGRNRITLPGSGFDFGNYRTGHGGSFAGIAGAAREFGDSYLADAAFAALDQDGGKTSEGGVLRYTALSNMSNANVIQAHVRKLNFWRDAIAHGPAASALVGPLLSEATYPDVLVARAFSGGDDLALTLYPGLAGGCEHPLGLSRLRPGGNYTICGGSSDGAVFQADAGGRATIHTSLNGRTHIRILPQS